MSISSVRTGVCIVAVVTLLVQGASAGDLKIKIPKRSPLTPVQRLNREGVDAVNKHQYAKAKSLFYKAYLYDPGDPFTLNNLGYMAELDGEVDRAEQFYELAAQQPTDAIIDRASVAKLRGASFKEQLSGIGDAAMRISRANVAAVHLLSQGRASEAEALLQTQLSSDPHNAFTLNNLGVAKEAEGDLESALHYYSEAAAAHSTRPVIVTFNRSWRGKPVSDMAAASADRLRERIRTETAAERAARLNARGVAAVNRNDWRAADQNFRAAYTLNPNSAFSLNNIGYLSEMSGDPETAQFFYEKARQAPGASDRIGVATRQPAEGRKLFEVSDDSDQKVGTRIAADSAARRRESGPVMLKHRDNTPVVEPSTPPTATPAPQNAPPPPREPQNP